MIGREVMKIGKGTASAVPPRTMGSEGFGPSPLSAF